MQAGRNPTLMPLRSASLRCADRAEAVYPVFPLGSRVCKGAKSRWYFIMYYFSLKGLAAGSELCYKTLTRSHPRVNGKIKGKFYLPPSPSSFPSSLDLQHIHAAQRWESVKLCLPFHLIQFRIKYHSVLHKKNFSWILITFLTLNNCFSYYQFYLIQWN